MLVASVASDLPRKYKSMRFNQPDEISETNIILGSRPKPPEQDFVLHINTISPAISFVKG